MISGSQIGQYRIVRKIAAGGMGEIFLAEHVLILRRAAIKTLLPSLSAQPDIVERFFNEARAMSAISDPGVVQIFDFGYHDDGSAYIVMELLEGEALATRIGRLKALPIPSALRIARQVAASLGAAHGMEIVHRDLKPENIFLIRDGEAQGGERAKVLDFGICKVGFDGDLALTPRESMLGTPVYMSPEQCRDAEHADHRSDIYALGCVLFHMLTGRTPFQGACAGEFIAAHLCEEPPLASTVRGDLPPEIDDLLQCCLSKSPDARYQSMEELQDALTRLLARLAAPEAKGTPAEPAAAARAEGSVVTALPAVPALDAPPPLVRTVARTVAMMSPLRRAALVLALAGVIVSASIATRLGGSDEALGGSVAIPAQRAEPIAPIEPVQAPPLVGRAATRSVAQVQSPAALPAVTPDLAPPQPEPEVRAPEKKPPRTEPPRPQQRAATEDLYELR